MKDLFGNESAPAKRPRCHNCKFATEGFKVFGKTHHNCTEPTQYPEEQLQSGDISAWDTLRNWYDTCQYHQQRIGKERASFESERVEVEWDVDLPF